MTLTSWHVSCDPMHDSHCRFCVRCVLDSL
jgi:hypothetical protein